MGASAGYARAIESVSDYPIGKTAISGVIPVPNTTAVNSPPITLQSVGTQTQDIRVINVTLVNNTGILISTATINGTIALAGITQPIAFLIRDSTGGSTLDVASGGVATYLIPLPYSFPLGAFTLNFTFGNPGLTAASGSVGYILSLIPANGARETTHLLPTSYTLSAAGDQMIIGAPGTGQRLYIYGVKAGNSSATLTVLGLQYGGATDYFDQQPLAASGGGYQSAYKNVIQLPENVGLVANLTVAASYVLVNVEYTIAP
jgi:hypothetical protein